MLLVLTLLFDWLISSSSLFCNPFVFFAHLSFPESLRNYIFLYTCLSYAMIVILLSSGMDLIHLFVDVITLESNKGFRFKHKPFQNQNRVATTSHLTWVPQRYRIVWWMTDSKNTDLKFQESTYMLLSVFSLEVILLRVNGTVGRIILFTFRMRISQSVNFECKRFFCGSLKILNKVAQRRIRKFMTLIREYNIA